jgi:hypothetical protein
MERGYLVASLALVVTFAGVSRGFRSLENMSFLSFRHSSGAQASSRCPAETLRREAERLRTHLRPHYAEEAQLLAEMNVPIVAEQMRSQESSVPSRAMQKAQRAQREVMQAQRDIENSTRNMHIEPLALELNLTPGFNERIQARASAAAARIAARTVRLQIAAEKLRSAEARMYRVDPSVISGAAPHVKCDVEQ